jgi:hypothetical protein
MKKIVIAILISLISVIGNAQTKRGGYPILNFGVSKGLPSFSSIDRGNWGFWISCGPLEFEFYSDWQNYNDLEEPVGDYYKERYKTYAGTSYTHVTSERYYSGAVGTKYGIIFSNYFSAGLVFEKSGSFNYYIKETTYLSTLHDGWSDSSITDNSKTGFGVYAKVSYPLFIGEHFAIMPFASAQIISTDNNFISLGIMLSIQN